MNYCITHDVYTMRPVGETKDCFVTSCPPPKDTRLIEDFDAPDVEELAQMDANAEELLEDFTGA